MGAGNACTDGNTFGTCAYKRSVLAAVSAPAALDCTSDHVMFAATLATDEDTPPDTMLAHQIARRACPGTRITPHRANHAYTRDTDEAIAMFVSIAVAGLRLYQIRVRVDAKRDV